MYTGRHPFHNYTVRKMYLTNSSSDRAERRVRLAAKDRERAEREQLEKQHDKQDGQEQDGLEGINDGQDSYAAGASAAAGQQPEPEGAGRGLDGEVEEAGEVSKAGGGGMSTGGGKRARKRAARAARDSDVLLEEDEESDGIGHGEVAEDEEALFALAAVFEGQGAAGSEVQQSQGQYDNIQVSSDNCKQLNFLLFCPNCSCNGYRQCKCTKCHKVIVHYQNAVIFQPCCFTHACITDNQGTCLLLLHPQQAGNIGTPTHTFTSFPLTCLASLSALLPPLSIAEHACVASVVWLEVRPG